MAGCTRPGCGRRRAGWARPSSPTAEQVSDALRLDASPAVRRRRRVAGLTPLAGAAYGVVATYQYGLLQHLPAPPRRWRATRPPGCGLFAEQVSKHRRVCGWCTLAAAVNLAAVAFTFGKALRADRRPGADRSSGYCARAGRAWRPATGMKN
jgi:hypothetical protein